MSKYLVKSFATEYLTIFVVSDILTLFLKVVDFLFSYFMETHVQSQFVAVPAINKNLISHSAEVEAGADSFSRSEIVHAGDVKCGQTNDGAVNEALKKNRRAKNVLDFIFETGKKVKKKKNELKFFFQNVQNTCCG